MTAVEWLVNEIDMQYPEINIRYKQWMIDQALEMEKQQREKVYSEEEVRQAIKKARDISDGNDCFDAEDISGCTEVCTYNWKFNLSEDSIIEQLKQRR